MFSFVEKYREYRAYNKYNYPMMFTMLGCGKTLLQFAFVFALAWYGLPMLIGLGGSEDSFNSLAQAPVRSESSIKPVQISAEIPAVAKTDLIGPVGPGAVGAGMYNTDWLLNQGSEFYVVQLASSTDKALLYQKAMASSHSFPAVVFPFKLTTSGRMMYGYSLGLYSSVAEAQASIAALDGSVVTEGVWIRKVGELQQKISSLQ